MIKKVSRIQEQDFYSIGIHIKASIFEGDIVQGTASLEANQMNVTASRLIVWEYLPNKGNVFRAFQFPFWLIQE